MEQIGRKSGYGEGTQQDSSTVYAVSMQTDFFKKDTQGKENRLQENVLHARKSKEIGYRILDNYAKLLKKNRDTV